jgi:PadR family transcriptional regulator PadR
MGLSHSTLKIIQVFLAEPGEEFCGSDLMDRADVSPGVVYPFLVKWEEEGLLKSRWEEQDPHDLGRPRKRFYELTRTGKTKARDALKPFVAFMRPVQEGPLVYVGWDLASHFTDLPWNCRQNRC